MAPSTLLCRKTREVNGSWPSPSSAPLCSSRDAIRSMSMSSGGRAIDRSTSQLIDSRRVVKADVPSSSKLIPSRSKSFSQKRSKSTEETADLITLESSSRYLLDHDAAAATPTFFDVFPDTAPAPAPLTIQLPKFQPLEGEGDASAVLRRPPSPEKQVVVLRVSLHCKGCARKVKKHISKMEGVTSFSVDLASKRVTVVGEVTPLGVLNSISKVKHAHFLQSVKPLPS